MRSWYVAGLVGGGGVHLSCSLYFDQFMLIGAFFLLLVLCFWGVLRSDGVIKLGRQGSGQGRRRRRAPGSSGASSAGPSSNSLPALSDVEVFHFDTAYVHVVHSHCDGHRQPNARQ